MKKITCVIIFFLVFSCINTGHTAESWLTTSRIAGGVLWADMTDEEMRETIDHIHERGQSVILTWVVDPLLEDWSQDLEFLKKASTYIHTQYPGMAVIIYQGPLEIVTPDVDMNRDGAIDAGKHSISTDHPEWLQIGIDGRKAIFYGDIAFWIGSTDEDVWLCPNDPEYREIVKSNFYELAQTGIDGIWVDIPKFQCDFGDWENNWACHCEDCRQQFKKDSGLNLPETVDWDSKTWKAWIVWRQNVIADYIDELNHTVKSAHPGCALIVEHWHGIDVGSVKEAWSPIFLKDVTDCLAHEYAAASYTPSTYDYSNYLRDVASYLFYRGVDAEHPSWILAYSSDKTGQKMLAASLITAGCNFYDTDVPDMAGTVNLTQQKEIFTWIKKYSPYYYEAEPWANVGVYYSKSTMDFLYYEQWGEGDFYCEFMGISMMLLSFHIPYKVIFSLDDLDQFHTVILPNTGCMSDSDIEKVNQFARNGGTVIATGESGQYDEWGYSRSQPSLEHVIAIPDLLGAHYYRDVQPFGPWWTPPHRGTGEQFKNQFFEILTRAEIPRIYEVDAPEDVIVLPFQDENTLIFRILNLSNISKGEPTPQNILVTTLWPVAHGSVYTFLESAASLEPATAVTVTDHAVLVFQVQEPVTVLANSFDSAAADAVATHLRKNGFFVEKSSGCPSCMERLRGRTQLIILGGHKAQATGELVDILLTDEEKQMLEQKGAQHIFVKEGFSHGQTVIIIAGNEREDTYALVETRVSEILRGLKKPAVHYRVTYMHV
jgi:hypothetical protein